jgi:hypothetical protein
MARKVKYLKGFISGYFFVKCRFTLGRRIQNARFLASLYPWLLLMKGGGHEVQIGKRLTHK